MGRRRATSSAMEELSAELRIAMDGDSAERDRLNLEIEFLLEESIIPEDD